MPARIFTPKPQAVGIIGAGVSGIATAAHLRAVGIDVVVFERASVSGGVWVYDEKPSLEPCYPAVTPSIADRAWNDDQTTAIDDDDRFAPPGPCYSGLKNNVSTPLLQMTMNTWAEGTEEYVAHSVIKEYIQDTADKTGIDALIEFNTRVESVEKIEDKWQVRTTTKQWKRRVTGETSNAVSRVWDFDAIVVASGHYHACRVPDIPGLSDWKRLWPSRIQHSKSYRTAEEYRGQNILLVGAGTSSGDIGRELGSVANKVYQVSRGGRFDLPDILLPLNAERISEISHFELSDQNTLASNNVDRSDIIPGTIVLKNGRRITDIHRIILATGYQFNFPFLTQYHSDNTPVEEADSRVLVTDGTQLHNLHKDIWYMPDTSLAFIGVPFYTATFTFFEFQAMALAAVWSARADLPSEEHMRLEYSTKLAERGPGRSFHSLKEEEVKYVDEIVAWLNRDAVRLGSKVRMEGHTKSWHAAKLKSKSRLEAIYMAEREKFVAAELKLVTV